MTNNNYLLREVKKEDAKAVWEIRNNPLNRKNFNNQEEIPFEQHKKWFEDKYLGSHDNKCFVLEVENKIIGYCRFDLSEKGYTTSIAIDPVFAGRGFGGVLLKGALKELGSDKDVFADIMLGNPTSLKIFGKNGFIVYKVDAKEYYLILKK